MFVHGLMQCMFVWVTVCLPAAVRADTVHDWVVPNQCSKNAAVM